MAKETFTRVSDEKTITVNTDNITKVEQTKDESFLHELTGGILGSGPEVTIHYKGGRTDTVKGSGDEVASKIGK